MENDQGHVSEPPVRRSLGRIFLDAISETILNFVFFILKFIAWGIQWSAALAVFVVVMAASGYYVYEKTLAGGEPVQVPNIVGLPQTEAEARLAERGLEMGRQQPVSHELVPKFHVISQRPESGRVVRTGRKVYPTISMGPDFLTAPVLEKRSLDDARAELANSRFQLGSVSRIPHSSPHNTVIAQDPPPGQNVPSQGSIHLLVSQGDAKYKDYMPSILGKPIGEVESILAPYNVKIVQVVKDIPNAREDVVLEQDPLPAALIFDGQVVTYTVKLSEKPSFTSNVRHVMNYDWYGQNVRIEQIDDAGNRAVIGNYPASADAQSIASRVSGSALKIPVTYTGPCKIEIYVDEKRTAVYELEDGQVRQPRSDTP